jgi:peptidoglycan/xylan/chitin deacetylase (PgdA/CDA1 family)
LDAEKPGKAGDFTRKFGGNAAKMPEIQFILGVRLRCVYYRRRDKRDSIIFNNFLIYFLSGMDLQQFRFGGVWLASLKVLRPAAALLMLGLATACSTAPVRDPAQTAALLKDKAPIRYLLTFDDGPAAVKEGSSTQAILNDLAENPVQAGIKAIFFVQTRASDAGGSALGREFMQREYGSGHMLGFHTATAGHSNHRYLGPEALNASLNEGIGDIRAATGQPPGFVRPPFWSYDKRTFAAYSEHGLKLMLTDLSANDGKTWGITISLRRRSSMLHQLAEVRDQILHDALPVVDGSIPVVVSIHDTNDYTAHIMQEYLQIMVDCAQELQLRTAAKPFYDDRAALERASAARAVTDPARKVHLPGLWNWIWH